MVKYYNPILQSYRAVTVKKGDLAPGIHHSINFEDLL